VSRLPLDAALRAVLATVTSLAIVSALVGT
jgi:hypothetical protein